MRRLAFALVAFFCQLLPASAQTAWHEYRSDAHDFAVLLPQSPAVDTRRIANTGATQTNYLIDLGAVTYLISVVQLEAGTGPTNPDHAYFKRLMGFYAEGSKTTLRTSWPAIVAGRRGIDGISEIGNTTHLVRIMAAPDRIYMIVYVGPKGQEKSENPSRFRASFKLTH